MCTTHSCTKDEGYSLLELMVVLAVMAFIAVIAAPRLGGFTLGQDLHREASDLTTKLYVWQRAALDDGTAIIIRGDPDHDGVLKVSGEEGFTLPGTNKVSVEGADGEAYILFASDGSTNGGRLRFSRGTTAVELDIAPVTGRVTTPEGP